MGFDTAISFLRDYRKERIKALNNEQRMAWSTKPLSTVSELFTKTFDSKEENTKWEGIHGEKQPNIRKLQAEQLKIAFLAGCRRDARILFGAWSDGRIRTPVDSDRYEIGRLTFNKMKLDKLDQIIKSKESG